MKILILSALMLLSSLAFSQSNPLLYTWDDENGTYSIAAIEEDGDYFHVLRIGTVSGEMLKARNRSDLAKILYDKGLKSCNTFEVFKVTKAGETPSPRKSFWILPGDADINPGNDASQFFSEAEIARKFPSMFRTEAPPIVRFEDSRIKTYEFDTYYQQYFFAKSDYIRCEHPTRKDRLANNAYKIFDAEANNVIAIYHAEKNDADKYFSFKNFEIIISSSSCDRLNHARVSFDFPRGFKEQITVFDINDSSKPLGQLLFFERMNAGKNADPNKANSEVVYIPNTGEVVTSTISFRPGSKGWDKIHGAFSDGENLFISYHSFGDDGSLFGMKRIGNDGAITDFKYSEEQLKENTIVPAALLGELNPLRKDLGLLSGKPAFRWGTQEFKMQGFQKTDSKLYVWGQAIYKVGDPDFEGTGLAPTIELFADGFVFVYDAATMVFENMFMLNLAGTKFESRFSLIATENDKVEFFIPVQSTDKKDYSKTVVEKNLNGDERLGNFKHLINPLLLTINGSEGHYNYYTDIYALDSKNGILICQDGSRYIVGFDAYAGETRDDDGELAYRNKHYFHIIPVAD